MNAKTQRTLQSDTRALVYLRMRLVARFRPTAPRHRRLFMALDIFWRLIDRGWAWVIGGSAAVAGLIGVITKRWPVEGFVRTHIALTVLIGIGVLLVVACAYVGHVLWKAAADRDKRLDELSSDYLLEPIARVDPKPLGVPRYIPNSHYATRLDMATRTDVDETVRAGIRPHGILTGNTTAGVFIVGGPLLGKTRLAYEAAVAELGDWRVVRWPSEYVPAHLDARLLWGEPIILWLDDLHKFSREGAARINNFLDQLGALHMRFRILATCRDDRGSMEKVHAEFMKSALANVQEIRPGFISNDEADKLARSVGEIDRQRTWKQRLAGWDHETPGSIVIPLSYYRNTVWPNLSDHAKYILWALRLLYSASVTPYESRVRAMCDEVFGWPHGAESKWKAAFTELVDTHYLHLSTDKGDELAGSASRLRAEPRLVVAADGLLEEGIEPYSIWRNDIRRGWPSLQRALEALEDAGGLVVLGDAFFGPPQPTDGDEPEVDPQSRDELCSAAECYFQALHIYSREGKILGRVSARYALATAWIVLAEEGNVAKDARATLLRWAKSTLARAQRQCNAQYEHDPDSTWAYYGRQIQDRLEVVHDLEMNT